MGIAQNLHPSFKMISSHQFLSDVVRLYGSMQQSITGKGKHIIRGHEHTQDGILTWKLFLNTFRYNGNVDVYLATQQAILTRTFHAHSPGDMM